MAIAEAPDGVSLPPGHRVAIPGRGSPWVWDTGEPASGPTVVLVHGWMSTAALTWRCCTAPLAERFRVVAPDMRGHGRGIRSWRPFRLEDCADDVAGLVTALGTGPVIVIGYSMGGPVAQLVWRRHPEVVAGLVMCATASTFARTPMSGAVAAATAMSLGLAASTFPSVVRTAGMRRMARSTYPADGSPLAGWAAREWGGADPAGLLGAGAALLRFDSSPWIATVDVPTGVIVTTEDQTVSPHRQRRLAETIPDAFTVTVAGGHRSCVEQSERFVPALVGACERVAGVGHHRQRPFRPHSGS
ncbi:MAG: alpha/beta hydrolase [Actinomycetota bacterium]|nr:alpha/beta hydrolase [Actinomycetota bacterium]